MADATPPTDAAAGADEPTTPSEDELREAYEAELRRITSADLLLQTAASLLNVGAYRLGLIGGDRAERDLEQVRDAIDGVRALLPILERRGASEQLRPLRDALSQLQLAYTREVQAGAPPHGDDGGEDTEESEAGAPAEGAAPGAEGPAEPPAGGDPRHPGPAESSGRLWVPGKG